MISRTPTGAGTRVREEIGQDITRDRMVRTARKVLTEEEAEDAAHDAVVQALVSADGFRADARVGTWLYRIAFNAALMQQRGSRRRRQRMVRFRAEGGDSASDAAWLGAEPAPSAARTLEEREARARLRAAVTRLPDAYRAVIERCVYAEEDADKVAADLGLSPSALRTRFARARAHLKALVDDSAPPPSDP